MQVITTAFFVDGVEYRAGTPLSKAPARVRESVIRSGWTMDVATDGDSSRDEAPPAPPAIVTDSTSEPAGDPVDDSNDGEALLDVSELTTRQKNVLKREGIETLAQAREAQAREGGLAAIDGITEQVADLLSSQL